ncbi:hypothetical protein BC936DRAFT_138145 [Jimgerdemannia flammicorona]|uniref:Uncharacterized protein n=1 Tax=Jimgerdemannia flammicorona TaxID=994334 RepID=A0A433CVS5_9FUNG|nr:hypothetical protein BC936DRAFT_138145 [Jimgerdemannia flammicorona]
MSTPAIGTPNTMPAGYLLFKMLTLRPSKKKSASKDALSSPPSSIRSTRSFNHNVVNIGHPELVFTTNKNGTRPMQLEKPHAVDELLPFANSHQVSVDVSPSQSMANRRHTRSVSATLPRVDTSLPLSPVTYETPSSSNSIASPTASAKALCGLAPLMPPPSSMSPQLSSISSYRLVEGRKFHNNTIPYCLPIDNEEAARLLFQHNMLKTAFERYQQSPFVLVKISTLVSMQKLCLIVIVGFD